MKPETRRWFRRVFTSIDDAIRRVVGGRTRSESLALSQMEAEGRGEVVMMLRRCDECRAPILTNLTGTPPESCAQHSQGVSHQ